MIHQDKWPAVIVLHVLTHIDACIQYHLFLNLCMCVRILLINLLHNAFINNRYWSNCKDLFWEIDQRLIIILICEIY